MKNVTRKRAEWIAAMLLGPLGGDLHEERWPNQGPWSKRTYSGRPVGRPRKLKRPLF